MLEFDTVPTTPYCLTWGWLCPLTCQVPAGKWNCSPSSMSQITKILVCLFLPKSSKNSLLMNLHHFFSVIGGGSINPTYKWRNGVPWRLLRDALKVPQCGGRGELHWVWSLRFQGQFSILCLISSPSRKEVLGGTGEERNPLREEAGDKACGENRGQLVCWPRWHGAWALRHC